MIRKPTITDVAQRAGVSKSTVSHVLNHTRFVEDKTRERVLQAVSELDYRPSTIARSLTTKHSGTIGMIISDSTNPFFGEILRGVEDVLHPANYGLIVCNTDEILEREAHYIDLLLRHQVDGIIAAATSQRWTVLAEAEMRHTPIVFVDRHFEDAAGPYIGINNVAGAYEGTKYLIDCGYTEIGIIAGFQRLSTMRERVAGFRQALMDFHIPVREEWVAPCPLTIEAGRQATQQVLSLTKRPQALFVNNNLLSLGALQAIRELDLRCPDEIALVGFDDHPWAAVSDPPLTVVRQPSRRIGQLAAEKLCAMIQGLPSPEEQMLLEHELIIRSSTRHPEQLHPASTSME